MLGGRAWRFELYPLVTLLNIKSLAPGTSLFGRAFEHFILQEIWAYRHYSRRDFPISFWRTASGSEVDLILGDADAVIEIKKAGCL